MKELYLEIVANHGIFTAAGQLDVPAKSRKTIIDQPGYSRGSGMRIARCNTGGYRLFVLVSGLWMDGSLDDIEEI